MKPTLNAGANIERSAIVRKLRRLARENPTHASVYESLLGWVQRRKVRCGRRGGLGARQAQ